MNLWILSCLLATFVGAWVPAVHAQGISEDCCLAYQRHLKWAVLRHARCYQLQEVSGSCNLRAVRFCLKQRVVCADPREKAVQRTVQYLRAQNKLCLSSQVSTSGHCLGRRKGTLKSRPTASKVNNSTSRRAT
ncbi:C-C motif chemokine 25 [Ochotona princeps]|uniref:C-C motif chemokine 25 n=1 Tax=Ochotona princeps TaxID=9978 RepID=UPI002714B55A|nr:C-C motif chemokine 25 [Ochotona princeps]